MQSRLDLLQLELEDCPELRFGSKSVSGLRSDLTQISLASLGPACMQGSCSDDSHKSQ